MKNVTGNQKYMLDTNVLVMLLRKRSDNITDKIRTFGSGRLFMSAITFAELEYGASHSRDPLRGRTALLRLCTSIPVLSFGMEAAVEYGMIREELTRQSMLIGPNDLLIAAHARSLGMTLVTHNLREFERVEGLSLADWA